MKILTIFVAFEFIWREASALVPWVPDFRSNFERLEDDNLHLKPEITEQCQMEGATKCCELIYRRSIIDTAYAQWLKGKKYLERFPGQRDDREAFNYSAVPLLVEANRARQVYWRPGAPRTPPRFRFVCEDLRDPEIVAKLQEISRSSVYYITCRADFALRCEWIKSKRLYTRRVPKAGRDKDLLVRTCHCYDRKLKPKRKKPDSLIKGPVEKKAAIAPGTADCVDFPQVSQHAQLHAVTTEPVTCQAPDTLRAPRVDQLVGFLTEISYDNDNFAFDMSRQRARQDTSEGRLSSSEHCEHAIVTPSLEIITQSHDDPRASVFYRNDDLSRSIELEVAERELEFWQVYRACASLTKDDSATDLHAITSFHPGP